MDRPATPDAIAGEILRAVDETAQVTPFSQRPGGLSVADAYRVTRILRDSRIARGDRPVGRKIGFTNRGIWPEYGVYQPIWGDVWLSSVADVLPGATARIGHLSEPRIEPEIVVCLADALAPGMTPADIVARIAWVAHGFEIVQSIYPGWRFDAADCIANGGLHGMLLIGPRVPAEGIDGPHLLKALSGLSVILLRDGVEMDRGVGANALDGPVQAIAHLVETLAGDDLNPPLAAGEVITTGTLTRAFPIAPGENWTTMVDGIGLVGLDVTFV